MDVAADYFPVIIGTSSVELDILNYARGESLNGDGEIYRRCEEGRAYYTLLSQIRAESRHRYFMVILARDLLRTRNLARRIAI